MRWIVIKEVEIPGIKVPVPKARWTEFELAIGECTRTEPLRIHTGAILLQMAVQPVTQGQGGAQPAANDYQAQRKAKNLIRALDANRDGECDIPLGSAVGLEDAWYEMLMEQAKLWPWVFRAPEIADLIEEWENAQTEEPLAFSENHHEHEPVAAGSYE